MREIRVRRNQEVLQMGIEIVKYSVVIIERLPDAFLVKCGYCKSSGEHPRKYQTCPVCEGKGRVLLRIPPDFNCDVGILKCAYCNGSGEHPRRYALCPTCGGAGSVWVGSLKEY